ncbi:histidine phosphatase family protein [Paenibacillus sp. JNUCC31]|nr:histidine phosphatase family protein [Paenibacillus sp. JNUCC-31]
MATTIGLIRHGVTEWNNLSKAQGISDIPLNEEGIEQATALAKRLSSEEWDVIFSSNLTRARQTAEIIQQCLGVPVFNDERIREINCGLIEGTTEEERITRWGANWREQNLGMEDFKMVAKRGLTFLEKLIKEHVDKRILVISHGALIGLSLQHLLPQHFQKTYIDNTSITILTHTNNKWACQLYNRQPGYKGDIQSIYVEGQEQGPIEVAILATFLFYRYKFLSRLPEWTRTSPNFRLDVYLIIECITGSRQLENYILMHVTNGGLRVFKLLKALRSKERRTYGKQYTQ